MIELVDVNKIEHHPDNPRKDLGDLTELSDSIKESGILQNLTLVPWYSQITGQGVDDPKIQEEMGYYVVIGNRRLAAAKLAGLEKVPCAILDMDHKTQIATMLTENMQRSDLTVYEQAQGMQMMLDLGETVSGISEKTGFSESTVRRRTKLLELDQDKLKETSVRGATMTDYIKLEQIKNIDTRNKVLEKIGTDDFNYSLKRAIEEEEKEQNLIEFIKEIKEFATEIEDTTGLRYVDSYYGASRKPTIPDDTDEVDYFFKNDGGWIYIYKEIDENEESRGPSKEELERREKRANLDGASKRAYELRLDFIKNTSNTKAKNNISLIIEYTIYAMVEAYGYIDYQDITDILDYDTNLDETENGIELKHIQDGLRDKPELYLLMATYSKLDGDNGNYHDWRGNYTENEQLDKVYDLLEGLEYRLSEEEISLKDGTHELYTKQESVS